MSDIEDKIGKGLALGALAAKGIEKYRAWKKRRAALIAQAKHARAVVKATRGVASILLTRQRLQRTLDRAHAKLPDGSKRVVIEFGASGPVVIDPGSTVPPPAPRGRK